ncbi:MAG: hypothetical protein D3923_10670 [Candidatus Electrothrix sp. AR3]|nr:hypothetical protein [Candidatus Electrothrix sp. AR3]
MNYEKALFITVVAAAVAVSLNLIVLKLFKQKSSYRAEHSMVGVITLMLLFGTFIGGKTSRPELVGFFLLSLIPCYLGTVFSDLDIKLLGIGAHRNIFFHSSLLFLLLFFVGRQVDVFLLRVMIAGFGIGLGSHLLWDLFDRAGIRRIPGRKLARVWLGSHALLCLLLSWLSLAARFI